MAVGETKHYPMIDPERFGKTPSEGGYSKDEYVYGEKFCTCGGIFRRRGTVEEVKRVLEAFESTHTGHTFTDDKVVCARAREQKRFEGFKQALARGEIDNDDLVAKGLAVVTNVEAVEAEEAEPQYSYIPTDWDAKNFGVTNEEVFADGWTPGTPQDEEVQV